MHKFAPPPQPDPILSFLHTFSPISARIGDWTLQTGNPGSTPNCLCM